MMWMDTFWWRVGGCLEREKEKRKIFHINKWLWPCDYIMYIYLKFCLVSTYFFVKKWYFSSLGQVTDVSFFSYYLPKEKKLRNKNIKTQQLKCFEWANLMLKIKISRDGKSFVKSQLKRTKLSKNRKTDLSEFLIVP